MDNLNKIQKEIKEIKKLQKENMNNKNVVTHNYIERRLNNIENQINKINNIVSASKIKKYIIVFIILTCVYKYYQYFKNKDIIREARDLTINTKSLLINQIQSYTNKIKNFIDSHRVNSQEQE